MTARWEPGVGRRVYDTRAREHAVVTDIIRRGLPRPVYVLRPEHVISGRTWETDQPARLRPVEGGR